MLGTLQISRAERHTHNQELLAKLRAWGKPATIAELFDQFEPTWAIEAAERLLVAGLVREGAEGRYEVVKAAG